jgi:outer membrane protein TolC
MKRIIVILIFVTNIAYAQQKQVVSLNDCYESMLINYPLAKQSDIYSQSSELNNKNIKAAWLPNAELNAQATYQSDVLKLDLDFPVTIDLPEMPKDQYKATVDIKQLIYDWGRIKSAKQLESVNLKTNKQTTQVELNKIKDQINKFYFAILILQCNEELLKVMLNDLETKTKSVESAVKNGMLLFSDLNALKAEKLKVNQSIREIENQRLVTIEVLSEITGISITNESELEIPQFDIEHSEGLSRPELILFDYQKEKLDATTKIISKQNRPTVFAFTQLGYGKPGLNMLSEQFDSYYYLGVGLNWKFWDWSKTKHEKQIMSLNKDLISTQESSFTLQMNLALKNENSKIKTYEEAIKSDIEIIKLREEVSESARSKLDNGIITSTEYITELSKETQAKISYETHKIQLIQSKVNYLYIKGEL